MSIYFAKSGCMCRNINVSIVCRHKYRSSLYFGAVTRKNRNVSCSVVSLLHKNVKIVRFDKERRMTDVGEYISALTIRQKRNLILFGIFIYLTKRFLHSAYSMFPLHFFSKNSRFQNRQRNDILYNRKSRINFASLILGTLFSLYSNTFQLSHSITINIQEPPPP